MQFNQHIDELESDIQSTAHHDGAYAMHEYPSPGARRRLTLNPPGLFRFEVLRLLDHELHALASRLRVLPRNPLRLFHSRLGQREYALAMTLVGAERIFGRSSTFFDAYKGSFRFPLWLSATRDGVQLRYFLDLRDTRGGVDLDVARFQFEPLRPRDRPVPPVESELSSDELDRLSDVVLDFVCSSGELLIPHALAFYRAVDSEFTLYGCRSGCAFEERYESREAFDAARRALTEALSTSMNDEERKDLETLLGDIERAELRSP